MPLLSLFLYSHGFVNFHFLENNFCGLMHFACNLCAEKTKKMSLCHLILWQSM
jgi:hypothetical protein